MTQEAMHAQMGGETGGTEEYIEAGAVTFGLEYRTGVGAMNDEGICIHVYGNDLEGDPLAWTLDKIRNRLPIMLLRCEADTVARRVDQRDVEAALPHIVAWAETKTHSRG